MVLGAAVSSDSASKARGAQEDAARNAGALSQEQYRAAINRDAPFYHTRVAANKRLSMLSGIGEDGKDSEEYGSLDRKFNQGDLAKDAVYQSGLQFGLDEGQKGIERQATARGSMLSGSTLKALSRYGTDYASTKAGGAYDRYTQENITRRNGLAALSDTGQTSNAQAGQAGQNYANNASQIEIGLGNARGASYIAQGNAISGALNSGMNQYQNNQYIDALRQPNKTSGTSGKWNGTNFG